MKWSPWMILRVSGRVSVLLQRHTLDHFFSLTCNLICWGVRPRFFGASQRLSWMSKFTGYPKTFLKRLFFCISNINDWMSNKLFLACKNVELMYMSTGRLWLNQACPGGIDGLGGLGCRVQWSRCSTAYGHKTGNNSTQQNKT